MLKFASLATIGNSLEWYDFTVYSFFTPVIASLFFPTDNQMTALLLAFATYGVGFIIRPLGGLLLGSYADRYGRKSTLMLTVSLMFVATAAIACAPSYSQAGIMAPVILICARLVQGFAVGGETGPATAFLLEIAPVSKRGFYTSLQPASTALAIIVGSLFGFVLTFYLDQAELNAWGWRLPFFFGLILGPIGLYMRHRLIESPDFSQIHAGLSAVPLRDVVRQRSRELSIGFAATILWTVTSYVLLFYMPTYAKMQLGIASSDAFLASMIGGVILFVLNPLFGVFSDKWGSRILMLIGSLTIGFMIYPAMDWLSLDPTPARLIVVQSLLAVAVSIFTGVAPRFLAELFPLPLRATGISVAYNMAVTIFGGFAALIVTWLIAFTGNKLAPAFYVIFAALVSFAAISRAAPPEALEDNRIASAKTERSEQAGGASPAGAVP